MSDVVAAVCLILILFLSSLEKVAIDGVVPLIRDHFKINDAQTAIIQTSSSIAYTVTLTLVWIFGDLFDRRKLILTSTAVWIIFSLLSIFLGSSSFVIFVVFRSLAVLLSPVFAVLTPVMLADMFRDRSLGVALTCLAASQAIASYLMSIISSWIISTQLPWQTGLLIPPVLVTVPLIALICVKSFRSAERSEQSGNFKRIFSNAFGFLSIKSYLFMSVSMTLEIVYMAASQFWLPSMYLSAWESFPETFLGLSYTMIITANSILILVGTGVGLPIALWFAQSWYHGTGPFSGRGGYSRAYPIVLSAGLLVNATMIALGILLLETSYVAVLVVEFFTGFSHAAMSSMNQLVMLMVLPTSYRAGALALCKLIAVIASIPSAQLIGMITDAVRGDSTLPIDRFHAYQKGMLLSVSLAFASAFFMMAVIIFFPADFKAAEAKDNEEQPTVDEHSSLIDKFKPRSESVLETLIKSRASTVNSTYLVGL